MKKFCFFFVCLSLFVFVSCGDGNGGDPEVISDAPDDDWDFSNVVSDDENNDENNGLDDTGDSGVSDDSDPSDSSADSGDDQSGNSGISDDQGNHGGNENPPTKGCGDGKIDDNERCDSEAPVACSTLNPYMDNLTKCLSDCTAYDMSGCVKKAWGVVNISFRTNFIMDNAKIGDPNYFAQGSLPYSAFNGIYGDDKNIFPAVSEGEEKVSVDGSVSFAVTDNYKNSIGMNKRQLVIKQNPASGYPRHELEFAPGGLKKGSDYRIEAVQTYDLIDEMVLKLVRYRLIEKQDNGECIMGIGYSGTVRINSIEPENADLYEGGKIEVVVNDLDFYHPDEIPGRDYEKQGPLPDEVLKYPLCSK